MALFERQLERAAVGVGAELEDADPQHEATVEDRAGQEDTLFRVDAVQKLSVQAIRLFRLDAGVC